jgi:uncharacterized protein (DUF1684 family)
VEDLDLADWRERVARLYLGPASLSEFRRVRDELFASHPQSPLPSDLRSSFAGLPYYAPSEVAVMEAPLRPASGQLDVDTGGPDGVVRYRRTAIAATPYGPLTLFWIEAYGGGLFLPVRDATSGHGSYGGGRYLTDTVKGTFGRGVVVVAHDRVRLDFNYLYNPSCAYDDRWACPLAPRENWLPVPIEAGEQTFAH